jgi:hypothetical protein
MRKVLNMSGIYAVIILVVTLLLVSTVSGIGVAPAKKTINFEPHLETQEKIRVLNPEGNAMSVIVYAKGPIKDYISFDNNLVVFEDGITEKEIIYTIKLPDDIEKPGIHETDIIVMELPKGDGKVIVLDGGKVIFAGEQTGTQVSATTSVATKVNVYVPYPGKYAEGKLFIDEAKVNESVIFTISTYNFGIEDIEKLNAKIEILGSTNELIGIVESNEIALSAKSEGKVATSWTARVNPGKYHAIATIMYDNKKYKVEKNFYVGNMLVEIVDVLIPSFSLGDIAKFEIMMENKWNQPIREVYANFAVLDENGREFTNFKTETVSLDSEETKKVNAYWDTTDVSHGEYDVDLKIHYAGKVTEKIFQIYVNLDSIKTNLMPVGRVINEQPADVKKSSNSILIVIVIILIAINLGWFVYFSRKKSGDEKKRVNKNNDSVTVLNNNSENHESNN